MTSKYQTVANQKGFVVLYPSSTKDSNCWDVASAKSLKRDGGGDSTGLANMVKWAITKYSVDPTKIFVTGEISHCPWRRTVNFVSDLELTT